MKGRGEFPVESAAAAAVRIRRAGLKREAGAAAFHRRDGNGMDRQETDNDRNDGSAILLGVEDVRAMLELTNAVRAAGPDPAVGKRLLLDGVCRLVDADSAMAVVNRLDDATARPVVVSAVYTRAPIVRRTGPHSPDERRPSALKRPLRAGGGLEGISGGADGELVMSGKSRRPGAALEYSIDAPLELDGVRLVAWLTAGRSAGDKRRFTPRHRAIIELLHAATRWLYAHDVVLASPLSLSLPPPQSDVLRRVLAGDDEGLIAAALRLDAVVVRERVDLLCRHFRVADRAQLAAMGRPTGAWPEIAP